MPGFTKTFIAAGEPEPLWDNGTFLVPRLEVQALYSNTDKVFVDTFYVADNAGIGLGAGEVKVFLNVDLSKVIGVARVADEGVSFSTDAKPPNG